jgi:hypothetical protein
MGSKHCHPGRLSSASHLRSLLMEVQPITAIPAVRAYAGTILGAVAGACYRRFRPAGVSHLWLEPETHKWKRPAIGKNRREARTTSLASTSVVKALWPRALTIR